MTAYDVYVLVLASTGAIFGVRAYIEVRLLKRDIQRRRRDQ